MTSRARPDGGDRCPGVLRPFVAGDGALVRLRVPGGLIGVDVLADLVGIAAEYGAPVLQLTSRGNLQLRALPDPLTEELIERIEATGLLPSASHERVRNILAAPLAVSLRPLVEAVDAAITSDPALSELPGRFLFAVSDESGSVLTEGWDLAYQALEDHEGVLLAGGFAAQVHPADAVAELIRRAHLFLDHRAGDDVWNVRDLPTDSPVFEGMLPYGARLPGPLEPGPAGADLVVGVPLGMLRPAHLDALGELADEVVLTPWKSFVVPGAAADPGRLQDAGLVTTSTSPWSRITACVGAPYCARTQTHTLDLATAATAQMTGAGPRIHVVGCERRCGEPSSDHLTLVAPTDVHQVVAASGDHR
ncbi:cobalamin biosynthesis protein CobG [Allobranchiibius sp. CTAmp26]|uniref:cobalamin biosynthesis protein CobG n=1 Tax=Allobranchiibius sp. CTAmp26 TaxID=2815214 RepID=UPI001AA1ACD9|nr:cobalamin biosynthesis protein CobG [Allobranchiibius sp. CTAmp26]MBO1756763.1 cobalamin biosynthesis protein CobG [Allobranchiibius sp. CTAmp26]